MCCNTVCCILQWSIVKLTLKWQNRMVTGIVANCPESTCRHSRVRSSHGLLRYEYYSGLHFNKTSLRIELRYKRRGPMKRVVWSHTVWSSEKGCAFEASSWELYGVTSHLKRKAHYISYYVSLVLHSLLINDVTNYYRLSIMSHAYWLHSI